MKTTRISILAVDDDGERLISLKNQLLSVFPDSDAHTAPKGKRALESAVTERPDTIMLSTDADDEDAIELCSQMKHDRNAAEIPVIIITGENAGKDFLHAALDAGADAFMVRPIDESALIATVRAMVRIKNANDAKRTEKERLDKLVNDRTRKLEHSQTAIMSLLKHLRESEERFRTIFDNIQDAYYEAGLDGTILEVSPSVLAVTEGQYRREDLIGKSMSLFYPDIHEREQLLKILLDNGSVSDFEITLKNRDGRVVPCSISSKLGFDETGKPVKIIGSLRNSSSRKQAERDIRLSETRLTRAEVATKSGNWEFHLETNTITASKGACLIYGLNEKQFIYEEVKSLPLPKFRPILDNALNDLLEKDKPYDLEFKISAADTGTIKDIHSIAFFDRERNTIFGVIQDVSDRKISNEALEKSERQKSVILETTLDGFWIIDSQRRFVEVNQAYCTLTGYTRDELMSMNVHDIAVNDKESEARERIARVIETGSERFEGRHRCKDGSIVSLEITIHYMADDGNFFMFLHDITERQRNAERINGLLREKDLILKEVHHRVKNNMNTIFGLLTIQANAQADESIKSILLDSACRVQSMMLLYEKLYRSENNTDISLREYLPELINEILGIFPQHKNIQTFTQIDDIVLNASTLSPLGIILNELITNTMKYAFVNRDHGRISILAVRKGSTVCIEFSDDGIGIPESVSFNNSSGFGMQLMAGLAKQMHGKISIDRTNGTKFRIELEAKHD